MQQLGSGKQTIREEKSRIRDKHPGSATPRKTTHLVSLLVSPFKGTVSRDFLLLVFLMNQFPPSPRVLHKDRFEFFRKFAEIIASQGAPPVSTTPAAKLLPVWTTPAANLLPVSATPAANFSTNFASVVDRWQIATGINDAGGKFATGVNDTGGK